MTHGRVTAPQMEDKVQIVRVMTHGRVTAPQMEDKVQIVRAGNYLHPAARVRNRWGTKSR